MLNIGSFNSLSIIESGSYNIILDGGDAGRLLLPRAQCPENLEPGDTIDVFVYLDSEGDAVPTTVAPLAVMGEVAWLEIVEVNQLGAFAKWGLPKDLFIPYSEQQHALSRGRSTLVKLYLDNQGRVTGTTRIDHWINDDASGLKEGQKVSLIIADRTELGFKAVINNRSWGLLYSNELFKKVRKGQTIDGYIKRIRANDKIDLTLEKPGFSRDKLSATGEEILQRLHDNNGQLALSDKSPPQEIYAAFGVSKKVFKQAIGALYKQRLITLEAPGIQLAILDEDSAD